MPGRLTLPARLRLRRKRDFDAAYARGAAHERRILRGDCEC